MVVAAGRQAGCCCEISWQLPAQDMTPSRWLEVQDGAVGRGRCCSWPRVLIRCLQSVYWVFPLQCWATFSSPFGSSIIRAILSPSGLNTRKYKIH